MKNNSKCIIKGCDRPIKTAKHQLCSAHLQRYYRKNDVGTEKIRTKGKHQSFAEKIKDKIKLI